MSETFKKKTTLPSLFSGNRTERSPGSRHLRTAPAGVNNNMESLNHDWELVEMESKRGGTNNTSMTLPRIVVSGGGFNWLLLEAL